MATVVTAQVYGAWSGRGTDLCLVAMLSFPCVGAVVVAREPRNAVGCVLLAIGVVWALIAGLGVYAEIGLTMAPALPGADVALVLQSALWVSGIGLIGTYLLLLFPDGHLPSPRWRPVAWWSATALTLCYCVLVLAPLPSRTRASHTSATPWRSRRWAPSPRCSRCSWCRCR